MKPIVLNRVDYRDRVHAGWLGKNIGGTLGGPYEGKMHTLDLDYYDPLPDGNQPNDDLDLQLVWLAMMEEFGVPPRLGHFADYWQRYLTRYPWDEYGFCNRNLDRGLRPPVSGWFENFYVDNMGSPIRSEIWACLAPADPQRAAALAWMDSALDHAGGEGTWGEMFWAAVESAAFVERDPETLIRIGLGMIPPGSEISRAIREALLCWQSGVRWGDARQRIREYYGHPHPCHAPQNHGFTIIGWLYGTDFGDRLCKAVNCGCDTDCTGATLGSLLGILGGMESIPERWSAPVGEGIKLHHLTSPFNAPKTLVELTDRTEAMAARMGLATGSHVSWGDSPELPDDLPGTLAENALATQAAARDVRTAESWDGDVCITLGYGGDPVLRPGQPTDVSVTASAPGRMPVKEISLNAPVGWTVQPLGAGRFRLSADEVADRNELVVGVEMPPNWATAKFTMLGPGEANGFPTMRNVARCPKCAYRVGAGHAQWCEEGKR